MSEGFSTGSHFKHEINKGLNIAATCPSTRTLGPGKRFAIWVQGCCFSCHNCGSPEWREMKDAIYFEPSVLAAMILSVPDLGGITISGGEPMLQAAPLADLVRLVRQKRYLSAICYTGFEVEVLRAKQDPGIDEFLSYIDVLIDGAYVDLLNDNKGWRGSSNQGVHFLSGLYSNREDEFQNRQRDIEIHLLANHCLIVGIQSKAFPKLSFQQEGRAGKKI